MTKAATQIVINQLTHLNLLVNEDNTTFMTSSCKHVLYTINDDYRIYVIRTMFKKSRD